MNLQELVEQVDTLVSLPEVCSRVNQMVDSPGCCSAQLGAVIAEDTDLSARLLKTVNSAFYGIPVPIETISRAVTIVGTHDLRNLALMTSACQMFRGIPGELVNMAEFWRIGVSTGVVARTLSRQCDVLHGERLFVQGVLHDIGRLVIFQQLPEISRDILLVADGQDDIQTAAEQDMLGFTHAEVGYALLARWGLPESILASVRFHHEPDRAIEHRLETSLIHIASHAAHAMHRETSPRDALVRVDPAAWEATGLMPEAIESGMEGAEAEVSELLEVMLSSSSYGGSARD